MATPLTREELDDIASLKAFLDKEIEGDRATNYEKFLSSVFRGKRLPRDLWSLQKLLVEGCRFYQRIWKAFGALHRYDYAIYEGGVGDTAVAGCVSTSIEATGSSLFDTIVAEAGGGNVTPLREFELWTKGSSDAHRDVLKRCAGFTPSKPSLAYTELEVVTDIMSHVRDSWDILRNSGQNMWNKKGAREFVKTTTRLKMFIEEEQNHQIFLVRISNAEVRRRERPTDFKENIKRWFRDWPEPGEIPLFEETTLTLTPAKFLKRERAESEQSAMSKPKVFIGYSHADNEATEPLAKRWLDRLKVHLEPLVQQDSIEIFSDQDICLGEEWHEKLQTQLTGAQAAVLLVSPNFLASEYIRNSELPVLLRNAKAHGVKVIPVILRPCLFEETVFKYPDPKSGPEEFTLASFQAAGSPRRALSEMSDPEQDRELLKVAKTLANLVYGRPWSSTATVPVSPQP